MLSWQAVLISAAFYSLIETATANGLIPYFYLRYLFERLPLVETEEDYRKLMRRTSHLTRSPFRLNRAL